MTFWEMMNTVRFRDIAGHVKREQDLKALRDILVSYQSSFLYATDNAYLGLLNMGNDVAAEILLDHVRRINAMLERDIVTIDTWMRNRDNE